MRKAEGPVLQAGLISIYEKSVITITNCSNDQSSLFLCWHIDCRIRNIYVLLWLIMMIVPSSHACSGGGGGGGSSGILV